MLFFISFPMLYRSCYFSYHSPCYIDHAIFSYHSPCYTDHAIFSYHSPCYTDHAIFSWHSSCYTDHAVFPYPAATYHCLWLDDCMGIYKKTRLTRRIITEEDLAQYKTRVKLPLEAPLSRLNLTFYTPRPPSSGVVVQFILRVLEGMFTMLIPL